MLVTRAFAVAMIAGLLVGPVAPAGAADGPIECQMVSDQQPGQDVTAPSRPLELMDVPQAVSAVTAGGHGPGEGIGVAVVDSGVNTSLARVRLGGRAAGVQPTVLSYHGTAMAGLISGRSRAQGGPVGIAPDATVVSVKVFDSDPAQPDQGFRGVTPDALVQGLTWVLDNYRAFHIRIVAVALSTQDTPALASVVAKLSDRGLLVVAAAGNRSTSDGASPSFASSPADDEDAADAIFPAGYPSVLAVSATADGAPGLTAPANVLYNSRIALSAPTYGAVTTAFTGSYCVLDEIATSWATAEIAGVAALVWSAHRDDDAAQILTRLVETATGPSAVLNPTPSANPSGGVNPYRSKLEGYGVVQPYDAVTRPMNITKDGRVLVLPAPPEDSRLQRATPVRDELVSTRHDLVLFGLVAGTLLLLGLILRPLVVRRGRR